MWVPDPGFWCRYAPMDNARIPSSSRRTALLPVPAPFELALRRTWQGAVSPARTSHLTL